MTVEPVAEAPARGRSLIPPFAVVACSVVFFWSLSVRTLVFAVMPAAAADLHLSSSIVGVVIATLLLGYCAGNWLAGWLPGSRKARIMGGVLLSMPAVVVIATAGNLWTLLVGVLALGCAVGVYLTLGVSLIVDAGARGGIALYLALHEVLATMGSFSSPIFLATVLPQTGWRGALLLWCLVGVSVLLLFAWVRDSGTGASGGHLRPRVPVDAALIYSILCYAVATILVMALTSVLPLIMVRSWGLGDTEAASVLGYSRLAGLIGVAIAGLVGHRWGAVGVTLGLEGVSLIGAAAMSLDGFGPLFLAGLLILTAGATGYIALVPAVIGRAYRPEQRERAMAITYAIGGILGMVVAPALFGVLIDAEQPTAPILISAVVTILAIAATWKIPFSPSPGLSAED